MRWKDTSREVSGRQHWEIFGNWYYDGTRGGQPARTGPKQVIGDWSVDADGMSTGTCADTCALGCGATGTGSAPAAGSPAGTKDDQVAGPAPGGGILLPLVVVALVVALVGVGYSQKVGPFAPKQEKGAESMYAGAAPTDAV